MNYIKEFCSNIFNTNGKIGRKDFIITWILVQVIQIILLFTIIGALLLPVIWIGIITMAVRRLNDINKSKWYMILGFIPLLHVFFFVYICFAKGSNDNIINNKE